MGALWRRLAEGVRSDGAKGSRAGTSPGRSLDHGVSRSALALSRARRAGARGLPRRRHARPHAALAVSDLREGGPRLPRHRRGRGGADRLHQQLHGPALRPLAPGHRRGGGDAGRALHVAHARDRERDRAGRGDLRPGAVAPAHPLHQYWHRGGDARHQGCAGLNRAAEDRQVRGRLPRRLRLRRGEPAPTGRARWATPRPRPPGCCRML